MARMKRYPKPTKKQREWLHGIVTDLVKLDTRMKRRRKRFPELAAAIALAKVLVVKALHE